MNLIIPMAGQGKRFRNAGFSTYKPFIPINGKPMLDYVIDRFPASIRKFVVTSLSLLTEGEIDYLVNEKDCTIVDIPSHQDGPAFSIYQAREKLPLDEPFFISYCDIFWSWDFEEIRSSLDEDGVIFTHTGFHPHLVKNNYSAFCLPQDNDTRALQEIREKESYTDDWMSEPLSVGVFYVKSGYDMVMGVKHLIDNDIRVSGEYFPSLLFNHMVQKKKRIALRKLDFFIHFGVPEQLDDYDRWHEICDHDKRLEPLKGEDYPGNIVVMGGLGKRMKAVSEEPKALIAIDKKPMFRFVIDHFPSRSSIIITTPAIAEFIDKGDCEVHILKNQTKSQYETILGALDILRSQDDFFLTSCDAYGLFDFRTFREFTRTKRPDAVIFTFKPSLMHAKMSSHHSHVSVNEDRITAVHIKSKNNPNDPGFAGFFWVKEGRIFDCIDEVPVSSGSEMLADHVFKYFVDSGMYVARFELDQYIHIGTMEEFLEYRYWRDHGYLFSEK